MSRAIFSSTRMANAAIAAPVIEMAIAPMMIVTCSTTRRPYGLPICWATETRRYSPPPTKLKTYDSPWLMNRAMTATTRTPGSGVVPKLDSPPVRVDPNNGSMRMNRPWTAQKIP